MYKTYLDTIMNKELSIDDAYSIGQFILSGDANDLEIASLLTALKFKDESYELIAGFAQALKLYSKDLVKPDSPLIDVCGTGGDGSNTFNISTTVSLLIASKVMVSKHGNRSISSKSGSADVIRALDIPLPDSSKNIKDLLDDSNYCFLFAPYMHPHMKYVMPVRTALAVPTIFNIVGPLCNPHDLTYQVVGVFKESLLLPMAKALVHLGLKRAAVIHGHGGLDELSVSGQNKVVYIIDGKIESTTIDPKTYGISYADTSLLKGGDARVNAEITKEVLSGVKGPKQDVVALNAGLALYISETTDSLSQGIQMAYKLLEKQSGIQTIKKLKGVTHDNS